MTRHDTKRLREDLEHEFFYIDFGFDTIQSLYSKKGFKLIFFNEKLDLYLDISLTICLWKNHISIVNGTWLTKNELKTKWLYSDYKSEEQLAAAIAKHTRKYAKSFKVVRV